MSDNLETLIKNIKDRNKMQGGALVIRPIGGSYQESTPGLLTFKMAQPLTFIGRPAAGSNRIQSGNAAYYPQYNSTELNEINNSAELVKSTYLQGGLNWSDVGDFFKGATSKILDIAAPALGNYAAGPAGAEVASLARGKFKQLTGLGRVKPFKEVKAKIILHKKPKEPKVPKVPKMTGGAKLKKESKKKEPMKVKTKKISEANVLKVKRTYKKRSKVDTLHNNNPPAESVKNLISALSLDDKSSEIPVAAGVGNFETLKGGKKVNRVNRDTSSTTTNVLTPKKSNMNKRFEIVKQIMKEKNLNLPQASKFVKENGLYKK